MPAASRIEKLNLFLEIRVFEKDIVRRIFGPNREDVA
jgi:hypothetical protein